MTTKTLREQLLAEIDQIPDDALPELLTYVQSLRTAASFVTQDEVWQAYLESEKEHEEVYRRLADS
jgi:hypothetical protein